MSTFPDRSKADDFCGISSPSRRVLIWTRHIPGGHVWPSNTAEACVQQNQPEMLQIEPLRSLLQEKWDRFASKLFLVNFLFYLAYLAIFTTVAFYRKEGQVTVKATEPFLFVWNDSMGLTQTSVCRTRSPPSPLSRSRLTTSAPAGSSSASLELCGSSIKR